MVDLAEATPLANYYKRKKLRLLLNDEDVDPVSLIEEAVDQLTNEDIINCIKLSLFLINK